MLRSKGIVTFSAFNLCLVLVACSAQPIQGAPAVSQQFRQVAASSQSGPVPANENEDIFEVDAWIDKPVSAQDEMVILNGNLQRNGIILGGIMMEASWPGEAQERSMPSCTVMVIYQRGVCYIDTSNFESGETVTVKLKFRLNEQTFTGETSFTVR